MKPFDRSERVAALIQRVISETLRKHIKDPRLAAATVTGVSMSRDLRNARIYFTVSAGPSAASDETERSAAAEDARNGFAAARGFLKRTLSRELDLRYMPKLQFAYDSSFDYGSRIDAVLHSLQADVRTNLPGAGDK
ncbi:MAG: ribosome-binding factor A [Desulfobacterales bacterium]|nr:MAG: ribosome-binding factor A [Desulfobacterales bacterium]